MTARTAGWKRGSGEGMNSTLLTVACIAVIFCGGLVIGAAVNNKEPVFFEPFDSDEDMWANIMAAYPTYTTMTDLQKTTALRTWASQHIYRSGSTHIYNHENFDNQHPYKIFNHFSVFHNGEAGVMCSGHAHALCVLYSYAGFPTMIYDYGGDVCSHSITLVRIMDNGEPKMIVQDLYFDYYYAWPNGTAMSIYDVFAEVNAERYDTIVPVYEKTVDYIVTDSHKEEALRVFGPRYVQKIDHDTVIYRYWYTPENYYNQSTIYKTSKQTLFGDDVTDLDLIVEKRWILYFNSIHEMPVVLEDFPFLEVLP